MIRICWPQIISGQEWWLMNFKNNSMVTKKEVLHMKKRRLTAFVLCLALVFSSVSTAFASAYCDYQVNGGICGKTLTWVQTGGSGTMDASHTYGGFLGIGVKTCNYNYFYLYYSYKCGAGHTISSRADRHEYGHTCGK